jgi:hypothetical protein
MLPDEKIVDLGEGVAQALVGQQGRFQKSR